jgi:hypothetical protein
MVDTEPKTVAGILLYTPLLSALLQTPNDFVY